MNDHWLLYFRSIGADSKLNFDNLREYVEMFGGQDTGMNNSIMTYMMRLIEESGTYRNDNEKHSAS
jgi:hypothetical protein